MQRSWRGSVDRGTLICVAFVILTMVLATSGTVGSVGHQPWLAVLLGTQIATLLICLSAARSGSTPLLGLSAGLLAVLGLIAALATIAIGDVPAYATHTLPANAVQLLHLVVIGFGMPTAAGVVTIVATGPIAVGTLVQTTDMSGFEATDRWILAAASSITVLVLLSHLRAAAEEADRATAQNRRSALKARSEIDAEHARDDARRLIHDEVITALRAIELERPRDLVRSDAQRAIEALTAAPVTADDVATLFDADPLGDASFSVTTIGSGWTAMPPPRVVEAFQGATSEALRNVRRHAGVDSAVVDVHETDGTYFLHIRDDGHGIAPKTTRGFGVRESIIGRMVDVGGHAHLRSGPAGTMVELRWPADTARSDDLPGRTPMAPPRPAARMYALTMLASIVANGYLAIRFPGEPAVAGAAVWIAITALMLAMARHLSRRAHSFASTVLHPAVVVAFCLSTYAITAVGVLTQSEGALLSAESWVVGFSSVGLILLAFGTRPWVAASGIAGLIATTAATTSSDPSLAFTEPVGAYTTCIVTGGTAIVAAVVLRRAGRSIARSVAVQHAQDEEHAWRTEVAAARGRFLTRLEHDVVPFLREVLDGSAREASSTAAVLAAQCRDELGVAEPLPDSTRDLARSARTRGVTLSIRSTSTTQRIPSAAWQALEAVLASATEQHVVTVVPPLSPTEPTRISCFPPLAVGPVSGEVRTDEIRTVVLVWSDPLTVRPAVEPMESLS